MKPPTRDWVKKAEADFRTAVREWRVTTRPNHDAVCFHVQQCIEKYMKARLQEADVPIAKTHNLVALLDLLLDVEPLWEAFRTDLAVLTVYAAAFRYPGESADKDAAREAIAMCRAMRKQMRRSLGFKR